MSKLQVQTASDWWAVLQPWKANWSDLTLIQLTVEHDQVWESWEVHAALLGFHLWVLYPSGKDETNDPKE